MVWVEFKGLYLLEESLSTSRTCFSAAGFAHSFTDQPSTMFVNNLVVQPNIWHLRLGYLSNAKLALMRNNNVPLSTINKDVHCEICPLAKKKRLPFPSSTHASLECFDLIHCDLWGPFSTPTIDGCRYFLTIVDDCSR